MLKDSNLSCSRLISKQKLDAQAEVIIYWNICISLYCTPTVICNYQLYF